MDDKSLYYSYSDYLKNIYGEKVYKLPINLPLTCPNRLHGKSGCTFCADVATGFEAQDSFLPVREQLEHNRTHIEQKYHAHKFIAYFQNYTNTFLPLDEFEQYLREAITVKDIVEISVSTRPDCIRKEYLEVLKSIAIEGNVRITIELGLQTVNYHTLEQIKRGHGLAEFLDAVNQIHEYNFDICVHVILNLPGDEMIDVIETAKILSAMKVSIVKIHSLYIAKNSLLCESYKNGTISLCSKEEYINRLITFLEYTNPETVIERLFSRIPEEDSEFSNWGISWWKLKDEALLEMKKRGSFQGKMFHYLNGAALNQL